MPTTTEWTSPELFMTHNGVNVFHAYNDDDMDAGQLYYWYTLVATEDGHAFDVRDLDVPSTRHVELGDTESIRQALREAIDAGLLDACMPFDPRDNTDPEAFAPGVYHVLVEVRGPATLLPGEALAIVNEMVSEGEQQAQENLGNGGVGGRDYLVTICKFSVTLP
jgi:hypothetical protein